MSARLSALNGRFEAIYLALAAAEVCWVAPVFMALNDNASRHPPLLLWLGLLALLLGFFYFYRALARAELSMRIQQSVLVVALLLSIGLVLRFHVYADAALSGVDWFLQPFRSLSQMGVFMPDELVAILTLVYLWARGIHLARRNMSVDRVGFSFRAGLVILVWSAAGIALITGRDVSRFVAPYFFFALVAVALARVEEVSNTPGSSRAPFTGFWIGSTVAVVALVVLLGSLVAIFFSGGSLRQVLGWFSPVLIVLETVVVAVGVLLIALLDLIFRLLPLDWEPFKNQLEELLSGFRQPTQPLTLPSGGESASPTLGIAKAGITIAVVAAIVALVVLFTWWRLSRTQRGEVDESRESLFSSKALAQHLRDMLQVGRDRLGDLAGLVDRFGLGSRLLSAISIRRIYANLVRLATQAGYPRTQAQTPYEYLEILDEALPGGEADAKLITDAYVQAHYGQVPDNREELDRIRDAWERIKAQGIQDR